MSKAFVMNDEFSAPAMRRKHMLAPVAKWLETVKTEQSSRQIFWVLNSIMGFGKTVTVCKKVPELLKSNQGVIFFSPQIDMRNRIKSLLGEVNTGEAVYCETVDDIIDAILENKQYIGNLTHQSTFKTKKQLKKLQRYVAMRDRFGFSDAIVIEEGQLHTVAHIKEYKDDRGYPPADIRCKVAKGIENFFNTETTTKLVLSATPTANQEDGHTNMLGFKFKHIDGTIPDNKLDLSSLVGWYNPFTYYHPSMADLIIIQTLQREDALNQRFNIKRVTMIQNSVTDGKDGENITLDKSIELVKKSGCHDFVGIRTAKVTGVYDLKTGKLEECSHDDLMEMFQDHNNKLSVLLVKMLGDTGMSIPNLKCIIMTRARAANGDNEREKVTISGKQLIGRAVRTYVGITPKVLDSDYQNCVGSYFSQNLTQKAVIKAANTMNIVCVDSEYNRKTEEQIKNMYPSAYDALKFLGIE